MGLTFLFAGPKCREKPARSAGVGSGQLSEKRRRAGSAERDPVKR
jgi:hypothetical protein